MRDTHLNAWLEDTLTHTNYRLEALSGDASFRRYLRLHVDDASYMIMDAPPDKEKVDEFVDVAEFLAAQAVRVPKIVAQDKSRGFLLLEDFGDELLSHHLMENTAHALYTQAMQQIIDMQRIPAALLKVPTYCEELLTREMLLFSEWFLPFVGVELKAGSDGARIWQDACEWIVRQVLSQPQVFVHRDYHSRNLMVLGGQAEFGVIDFQDAVVGAHSYDLVSIIRDAYVAWDSGTVRQWIAEFWQMQRAAGLVTCDTEVAFQRDVDIMGVQRQLKVLGIFVRLAKRDGKMGYLDNLTQVMAYMLEECAELSKQGELSEFNDWLTSEVLPKFIAQQPDEREHLTVYLK